MLVQGSCNISRPFGEEKVLRQYLREGQVPKLRRRLEADAKSLFAMYQYARLHGAVRVRWGFLDEMLRAPWVHSDEPTLHQLKRRAHDLGVPIEVVDGSAPGWAQPWSRARTCFVHREANGYDLLLIDQDGLLLDDRDVQLARLVR
jgi:hypothetical protein